MTQQVYFVCSIGPVQDFIQTARTSQDLWFGSWMLSELSKAAAKVLKDAGHTLIFPAPGMDLSPDSGVDVTNKVVALMNNGTPQQAADAILAALEQRRNALRDVSFGRCRGKFREELANAQLKTLTEFYWAAAPMEKGYEHARKRAEALLAARKNTRDFGQAEGVAGLPKSSLDGWRESVLLSDDAIEGDDENLLVEEKDTLSGMDLLKRFGKRAKGVVFESTTDIAVKPFRQAIGDSVYHALLSDLKALRKEFGGRKETDGTHFYEDRMVQLLKDKTRAPEFRKKFNERFKKHGVDSRPSPYYALLLADGDNMGRTIDALTQQSQHSDLSKALSDFAPEAKEIILAVGGVPMYVGGDDVLAYLPAHTALACIVALNDKFNELVGNGCFEFEENGKKKRPSLSVGLAIAHHLTPLSDALEQARSAEKEAKKIDGKNALLISMSKRGGSERKAKGKLDKLVERMMKLIELTQEKAISHGAAYELEDLQKRMQNSELPAEALEKEALRILKRKRESGSEKPVDEEKMTELVEQFRNQKGELELNELASELILAAEIANVMPKKEQQP